MEIVEENDLCFPQMLNASCKKIVRPYITAMLIYTLLYVISLVTAFLNLLVIISISHYKQLHTPINFLVLSLAVSDFCVGLLMFFQILFVDGCWLFGDVVCIIYQLVSFIVTSASLGTIVLISVERYIAICQPLHYHAKVTKNRVRFCVGLSWFCSAFYNLMVLKDSTAKIGSFNSCYGECGAAINYIAGVIDILVSFLIPVTAISVLYMRVFAVVVTQVRTMRSQITAAKSQKTVFANKSELKAARTLGIIIVMYVICLCPYYIVIIGQDAFFSATSAAVIYLIYFNSCLNPVIYTFCYSWFRKCLKDIVTLQILQPGSSRTSIRKPSDSWAATTSSPPCALPAAPPAQQFSYTRSVTAAGPVNHTSNSPVVKTKELSKHTTNTIVDLHQAGKTESAKGKQLV
ncbi:trace amine-associated receptor 13c-like [Eucyclogobius newberryi]|uniref:trace amine-associated receptor 13c-like n=1 Tax=Eucyclogobius newberryi TaxID=166745 RepID=UPI003B59F1B4